MHEKLDDNIETITCSLLAEYIKSLGISYSDVVLDMLEIYERQTTHPASIPIYLPSSFIPETRIYKLIEVFVDSFLKDLQTRHVLSRQAVPGGGTEAWYEVARPEFFQYAGQAELPDRVSRGVKIGPIRKIQRGIGLHGLKISRTALFLQPGQHILY